MGRKPNKPHRDLRKAIATTLNRGVRSPNRWDYLIDGLVLNEEDHDRFFVLVSSPQSCDTLRDMFRIFWTMRRYELTSETRKSGFHPSSMKFRTKKDSLYEANFIPVQREEDYSEVFVSTRYKTSKH